MNRMVNPGERRQSVLMAAGTVHMAVLGFFSGRLADLDHFDREVESLTGERVVEVHGDLIPLDLGDGPHERVAVRVRGLELEAGLEVSVAGEAVAREKKAVLILQLYVPLLWVALQTV